MSQFYASLTELKDKNLLRTLYMIFAIMKLISHSKWIKIENFVPESSSMWLSYVEIIPFHKVGKRWGKFTFHKCIMLESDKNHDSDCHSV